MSNQFREKYDELMNKAFRLYRRVLLTKLFVMKFFRKQKRELKDENKSVMSEDFYTIDPFDLDAVIQIESDEFMSSSSEQEQSQC